MKKKINFDNILYEMVKKLTGIEFPDMSTLDFLDWDKMKIIPIKANLIINEDDEYDVNNNLYQTRYFIEFFETIKNIKYGSHITGFKMKTIFKPIFDRPHKFNKDKNIFILKFLFNRLDDFIKAAKQFSLYNSKINYDYYENIYKELLYPNYAKYAGLYVPGKDETLSVMFINTIGYNENTIKHELIHYFQDNLGISLLDNINIDKDKFNNYGLCKNIEPELLFREQEYVSYANEICYVFELFGIKTKQESFNTIIKFKDHLLLNQNMIDEYIQKCKKLPEYNWFVSIKKEKIIEFFMLCNIYAYDQCEKMTQIIEEYFK